MGIGPSALSGEAILDKIFKESVFEPRWKAEIPFLCYHALFMFAGP